MKVVPVINSNKHVSTLALNDASPSAHRGNVVGYIYSLLTCKVLCEFDPVSEAAQGVHALQDVRIQVC